jgi:protoheme IX farnesyltransferase
MGSLDNLVSTTTQFKKNYWPLIKSRQTFLLALTGVAGYLCQRPVSMDWPRFAGLVGSLLITIGGCTVLNMVFDRDIDQKMARTRQRPLAATQTNVGAAAALGSALIVLGLLWALSLSVLYFSLALAGAGLDVLVYTIWLKRRSAWSILWGGLSGGIPILASRALVVGRVDATGLLLAFAIVCWIPSHNLTLGMLYSEDYLNAGVPTFINVYGLAATRAFVTLSSLLSVILMAAAFIRLQLSLPIYAILGVSSLGLVGLALYVWAWSSQQAVGALYKYSSFYMLAAMVLLLLAALK